MKKTFFFMIALFGLIGCHDSITETEIPMPESRVQNCEIELLLDHWWIASEQRMPDLFFETTGLFFDRPGPFTNSFRDREWSCDQGNLIKTKNGALSLEIISISEDAFTAIVTTRSMSQKLIGFIK